MNPRAHCSARHRARRYARGATVTEYAIILFLVVVVGAVGFRFLGDKLGGGVGKAGSNLEQQNAPAAQADSAGAGGGLTTSHGAKSGAAGGGGDPNASYGGPRAATTATPEGTPFAKFAMIALGIVGAGAAFFAAMKGKHAR